MTVKELIELLKEIPKKYGDEIIEVYDKQDEKVSSISGVQLNIGQTRDGDSYSTLYLETPN